MIVHKVMVHLPDVEPDDALRQQAVVFLRDPSADDRFYYGPAFARKYRGGQNAIFRPDWNWLDGKER